MTLVPGPDPPPTLLPTMDEDENLSTLLAMGFPDLSEIKRALRLAKNDLNEAVAILTNEQPVFQSPALSGSSSSHIEELASLDIDMKDSASGSGSGSGTTTGDDKDGADQGFPVQNFYELEQRVFQVRLKFRMSIP